MHFAILRFSAIIYRQTCLYWKNKKPKRLKFFHWSWKWFAWNQNFLKTVNSRQQSILANSQFLPTVNNYSCQQSIIILANSQFLLTVNSCQQSILANSQFLPTVNSCQQSILANSQFLPTVNSCQQSILANSQFLPTLCWLFLTSFFL